MNINTHNMISNLYEKNPDLWDEQDRLTIWSYIQTLVIDAGDNSSDWRHADAMRILPRLRFENMSQPVKAMFKIAFEGTPSAQNHLLGTQLISVMQTKPLKEPFIIRHEPHGLAMRYHNMNICI